MRSTSFITILALGLGLAQAQFQVDVYSETNCGGDLLFSITGTASRPDDGTQYDYTGHVGSANPVKLDDWTTQINTNNGCIATDITCCQYAPECTQGVNLSEGQCLDIDQDVTAVGTSFTVCDSACIDTGYKRGVTMFTA